MATISKRVKWLFNKKTFNKKTKESESPNFLENGGLLMEKLLSLSKGREEIYIKRFTIPEIKKMTNNFKKLFMECVNYRFGYYKLFKGNLDGRPILVQIYLDNEYTENHEVAFATAISAHMSHLKYTLKLIGCCTDYQLPASVYEFAGTATLEDLLREDRSGSLSWGRRVKIARDVAAMVLYLHTSFPLPIIHRDLKPSIVLIDINGDAKLFDFSLAIEIPQGESEVEDDVKGTLLEDQLLESLEFLDPEYNTWNRVTTKMDVYSFGLILLMLLAGKNRKRMSLRQYLERFRYDNAKLIDRNIAQEVGMHEFRAIKDLALSCTRYGADHRPEMIDVARRLHAIEKLVNKPSSRIVPSHLMKLSTVQTNSSLHPRRSTRHKIPNPK